MSTAHRPTWDPAQARDVKGGSRQFSVRDMAAHTKLKFRYVTPTPNMPPPTHARVNSQPGQTSTGEVARRDLRAELFAAEEEARDKKRKAEGRLPVGITAAAEGDEETLKRRKLLQEALELDKDDDEDEDEPKNGERDTANDKAEEESEEESEDEDDTDELLRELEKIKRERAEEKARQEREQLASQAAQLESPGLNTTVPGTFSVKKRWDDGGWVF